MWRRMLLSWLSTMALVAPAYAQAPADRTVSSDWLNASMVSENDPSNVMVGGDESSCHNGGCNGGCGCVSCDACNLGNWLDNTEVFFGGDSYAALGDFPAGGYQNSFGLVSGMNTGFRLGDLGIRGQFGASYGFYDFKGRGFGAQDDSLEEQIYLTGGVYRRANLDLDERLSWGVVMDAFVTDNWGAASSDFDLTQIRGTSGWALNEWNEVGVWGTFNASETTVAIPGRGTPSLRAMKQANVFWKRHWDFGTDTSVYVGSLDSADVGDWVFGFTGRAPLSHRTSLYGGFTYVTPSVASGVIGDVEDTWNVNLGLVFSWGGKAVGKNVAGNQGLPLLPVANNGSFLITD